jgi:putative endonuclease
MNSDLVQSIADLSSRWRNHFWPSKELSDQPENIRRGSLGENEACRFLRKKGYKVLYRNFKRKGGGEIDIVCRDGDTLVFVEVKTRATDDLRRPVDDIRASQKRRISKGALTWLRMLDNPDIVFRFDVVEIIDDNETKPRLELIQNAFELSKPYMY